MRLVGLDAGGTPVCVGVGVVVSADGVILTTAEMAGSSGACPIETIGVAITGDEQRPPVMSNTASLIEVDQDLDVALIEIDGWADPSETKPLPDFAFAPLGDSDALRVVDRLQIVAYPTSGGDPVSSRFGVVDGFTLDEGSGDRSLILVEGVGSERLSGVAFDARGAVVGIPAKVATNEIRPINLAGPLLTDHLDNVSFPEVASAANEG